MDEWIELQPTAQAVTAQDRSPIRVGMIVAYGGVGRLSVLMDRAVLEALGGKSFRYRVARGSGANRHLLRIAQDDSGAFEAGDAPGGKGKVKRIICPPHAGDPSEKRLPFGVHFKANPGQRELIISLPAWVWNKGGRA